jgi:hypothetical protein
MASLDMLRARLLGALFLFVPLTGQAQEIYKCVSADGVAYQGHPCPGYAVAAPTVAGNTAQATPECGPRPLSPPRLPWRQATICIGMTDDEVLNLPGWGRPSRIDRSREQGIWHEEWTYDDGFARRSLHFVNARLAGLETAPVGARDRLFASAPGYD